MRRREFIKASIASAATWPLASHAQQAMPVIGLLSGNQFDERELGAVRRGLGETGYIEGGNVSIEYRSAAGRLEVDYRSRLWRRFVKSFLLIAAALIWSLPATAQNNEFHVVQDTRTKRCTVVDKKPSPSTYVTLVSSEIYKTKAEAEAGIKAIEVCPVR